MQVLKHVPEPGGPGGDGEDGGCVGGGEGEGGGGEGEGGGGEGEGGGGDGGTERGPQSVQSVPYPHAMYWAPGPPSSHMASLA